MSNPVFIVNTTSDVNRKIIIRFFESAAASFDLENKVFANAAQKGMAPGFIESDWKTYRVEEFFAGRPYQHSELLEAGVLKQTIPVIADFNYDPSFFELFQEPGATSCDVTQEALKNMNILKSYELVGCK